MKNFYKDLREFQRKYPMCYIEAWTPEDYVSTAFQDIEEGEAKEVPADWNDEDHQATTEKLYDTFDANYGTNWERLRECLK